MGYLQDFEKALRAQLEIAIVGNDGESAKQWLETTVDFVKKAVFESYCNGLKASRGARGGNGQKSALAAGKLKPAKPAQ
jgi:hypothetical protein